MCRGCVVLRDVSWLCGVEVCCVGVVAHTFVLQHDIECNTYIKTKLKQI
jgi:hypothetical protein